MAKRIKLDDSSSRKIEVDDADPEDFKHIKDPIYGSIELHPLLYEIINTPEFQRLRFIRQLGCSFYVYPGATHTRFEHSIGVCHLAGEFARMLKQNHPELNINQQDILAVEVAGLCHDLGHGPFSHVFEDKVQDGILDDKDPKKKKLKHEDISRMIFQRIYEHHQVKFRKYGVDPEYVKNCIAYKEEDIPKAVKFLYQIVANKTNGIDVDKWDYFIRDCHYMGLQHEFDYKRLMQLSRVVEVTGGEKVICYHEKEADNILGMFRTRCSLFKKAYGHKTVVAIEHMVSFAMLEAKHEPLVRVNTKQMSLVDIVKDLSDGKLDGFLNLTDDIIGIIKARHSDHKSSHLTKAQQWIDQTEKREIPHIKDRVEIPEVEWDRLDDIKKGLEKMNKEIKEEAKALGDKAYAFVHLADFSYQSEKKGSDPYKKVYFYSKQYANKAELLKEEKKSKVFVPQAWGERAVWIYTSGSNFPEAKIEEYKSKIQTLIGPISERS